MKKIALSLLVMSVVSCRPFDLPNNGNIDQPGLVDVKEKTMAQLVIPNGFTFETSKSVNVNIEARDNGGNILKNVAFNLFVQDRDEKDSVFLMTARTNDQGLFTSKIKLESTTERIIAVTNYVGLPPYQTVNVVGSSNVKLSFGSENTVRDGIVQSIEPNSGGGSQTGGSGGGLSPDATLFTYMGTFNSDGVPSYLLKKGDAVSQDVLNVVNASLPEGRPVPTYNPEYISTSTQNNIVLKDSAEVWVTFVHEGAGYRNAVGYYSYPTNNPPLTAAAILQKKIIFPNNSFAGSGGGLKTGDKVSLGRFSAGTTISWFLVPDGWVPSQKAVSDTYHPIRYSDRNLNTFTSSAYRSHTVLLADPVRQLLLLGFEDLDRPSGDNDFNDAVFYATASPYSAINTTNMVQTKTYGTDTDGDGVPDSQDVAPNDPTYAFVQYSPSSTQFGTLAFEDSFPSQGDYDMNDLVVDHQFELRLNAANKVTSMRTKFILRALGASFRNGFGFELPIPSSYIASATGASLKNNIVKLNANGTEGGHTNAVFIAFDNAFDIMSAPGGGFVNTEKGKTYIKPDTVKMIINFSTPVTVESLGDAPYNPFIFVNRDRSREVHLAGYKPTNLANLKLFGTADDDSGTGKYYQTKNNLPWGIQLPTSFAYPIEKEPINKAYLKFNEWSESKGTLYPDWYKSTPNYRNTSKIY
jgi:LruC domain-containing protein